MTSLQQVRVQLFNPSVANKPKSGSNTEPMQDSASLAQPVLFSGKSTPSTGKILTALLIGTVVVTAAGVSYVAKKRKESQQQNEAQNQSEPTKPKSIAIKTTKTRPKSDPTASQGSIDVLSTPEAPQKPAETTSDKPEIVYITKRDWPFFWRTEKIALNQPTNTPDKPKPEETFSNEEIIEAHEEWEEQNEQTT
jgi:uncharacterized protein HemX